MEGLPRLQSIQRGFGINPGELRERRVRRDHDSLDLWQLVLCQIATPVKARRGRVELRHRHRVVGSVAIALLRARPGVLREPGFEIHNCPRALRWLPHLIIPSKVATYS